MIYGITATQDDEPENMTDWFSWVRPSLKVSASFVVFVIFCMSCCVIGCCAERIAGFISALKLLAKYSEEFWIFCFDYENSTEYTVNKWLLNTDATDFNESLLKYCGCLFKKESA